MKFIHISDLHIGIRLNEYSLIEDQKYILNEILGIIDDEKPDGVLIAGDVYDKSIPNTEAVELFDDFLVSLSKRSVQVFVISGNHDSAERLAFCSRIIAEGGIHISPVYDGEVQPVPMTDEFGAVNVYMLPFVKPAHVRKAFPDREIESYTDAISVAVEAMNVDKTERNIMISHQFVTGAVGDGSERISVGGTDNVDSAVYTDFDYTALGHIHSPQNVGSESVRYSGTPLKYSFSEAAHNKSVTVVELGEKGSLTVKNIPLIPMREMREIRGTYSELTLKSFYENTTYQDDYLHITLTDEEDVPNALGKLRVIYRNIMKLDYDNTRTRHSCEIDGTAEVESKSPLELFSELFELQNNAPMSKKQMEFMEEMIKKVWEDE